MRRRAQRSIHRAHEVARCSRRPRLPVEEPLILDDCVSVMNSRHLSYPPELCSVTEATLGRRRRQETKDQTLPTTCGLLRAENEQKRAFHQFEIESVRGGDRGYPANSRRRPPELRREAPTACAPMRGCGGLGSADEVGFVNHSAGLPSGDADEDALVQPLQVGGGGLDLG